MSFACNVYLIHIIYMLICTQTSKNYRVR